MGQTGTNPPTTPPAAPAATGAPRAPATPENDQVGGFIKDTLLPLLRSLPFIGGFVDMLGEEGIINTIKSWIAATPLGAFFGLEPPEREKTAAERRDEAQAKAAELEVEERQRRLSGDFRTSAAGPAAAPAPPATTQAFSAAATGAPGVTTPPPGSPVAAPAATAPRV